MPPVPLAATSEALQEVEARRAAGAVVGIVKIVAPGAVVAGSARLKRMRANRQWYEHEVAVELLLDSIPPLTPLHHNPR